MKSLRFMPVVLIVFGFVLSIVSYVTSGISFGDLVMMSDTAIGLALFRGNPVLYSLSVVCFFVGGGLFFYRKLR